MTGSKDDKARLADYKYLLDSIGMLDDIKKMLRTLVCSSSLDSYLLNGVMSGSAMHDILHLNRLLARNVWRRLHTHIPTDLGVFQKVYKCVDREMLDFKIFYSSSCEYYDHLLYALLWILSEGTVTQNRNLYQGDR